MDNRHNAELQLIAPDPQNKGTYSTKNKHLNILDINIYSKLCLRYFPNFLENPQWFTETRFFALPERDNRMASICKHKNCYNGAVDKEAENRIHFIILRAEEQLMSYEQKSFFVWKPPTPLLCLVLLSTLSSSLLINGSMNVSGRSWIYSANIFYAFFNQRVFKYRKSEQTYIEWCYNMNIRYRIRLFIPTLVKDKGRACLIALFININVKTHLIAIKRSKGR